MKKQDVVEDFPDRVSGIFCYSESYQNIPKLLFPKFLWHDHDDVDADDNNDDDDEDDDDSDDDDDNNDDDGSGSRRPLGIVSTTKTFGRLL